MELLEARLVEFSGTLLLVSHDREFLNNVVTSTIVFESSGVREYVGGYDDWLRQRESPVDEPPVRKQTTPSRPPPAPANAARRLSFNEKRELESLPQTIEDLEQQLESTYEAMAGPDFYQQPRDKIAGVQNQVKDLEQKLATAYGRWEELSDKE